MRRRGIEKNRMYAVVLVAVISGGLFYYFLNGNQIISHPLPPNPIDDLIIAQDRRINSVFMQAIVRIGDRFIIAASDVAYSQTLIIDWNYKTKATKEVSLTPSPSPPEYHLRPTLFRDRFGYLYVWAGYANYGLREWKSRNPDNIDAWDYKGLKVAYGSYFVMFEGNDGNLYGTYRDGADGFWRLCKSSDRGDTWTEKDTIYPTADYPCFLYDKGRNRIWGISCIGRAYGTKVIDGGLWFAYSDDYGNTWKNTAGTTISYPEEIYSGWASRCALSLDNNKNLVVISACKRFTANLHELDFTTYDNGWRTSLINNNEMEAYPSFEPLVEDSYGVMHVFHLRQQNEVSGNSIANNIVQFDSRDGGTWLEIRDFSSLTGDWQVCDWCYQYIKASSSIVLFYTGVNSFHALTIPIGIEMQI